MKVALDFCYPSRPVGTPLLHQLKGKALTQGLTTAVLSLGTEFRFIYGSCAMLRSFDFFRFNKENL